MRTFVGQEMHEDARVEVSLIGPDWLRLIRYRFYMESQPEDHLTVWKILKVEKLFGSYTPPGWFLRIIGQVK